MFQRSAIVPFFLRALLISGATVTVLACGSGIQTPASPSGNLISAAHENSTTLVSGPGTAAQAAQAEKTIICHRTNGANEFIPITVGASAIDAHLAHGDGRVGDPVPSQPSMIFDEGCIPTPVHVTPVLDQSYDAPPFLSFGFGGDTALAQTFTVGISGVLTQVDVEIRRDAGIPDLVVDVRPTAGGLPVQSDAAALASVVIPSAVVPPGPSFTFVSVDVSSAHVHVSAGDVLAIVLRAPGPGGSLNYSWQGSATSEYASGADFFRRDPSPVWDPLFGDLSFRTFVEPASLLTP